MGHGTSFVNENELDEVRTIEDGFRKAYSGDQRGTIEAINRLRDFVFQLIHLDANAENELDLKALIISIGDIARVAAEKEMQQACAVSCYVLGDIVFEAASQKRETIAIKALSIIGSLAQEIAEKGLDTAAKSAAESLGNCGKNSSRMKMETLVSLSEVYLMQVALKSIEKVFLMGIAAIDFLGEIGVASAEQEIESNALEAAVILEDLGNAVIRRKTASPMQRL